MRPNLAEAAASAAGVDASFALGAKLETESKRVRSSPSVLILGVGSFAHSTGQILRDAGAEVSTYLTRSYAHYPPSLVGAVYRPEQVPSPGAWV